MRTGSVTLNSIPANAGSSTQSPTADITPGTPVTLGNPNSVAAKAYFDAARRLRGETLVVTVPAERRSLMGRLFGRRAVA